MVFKSFFAALILIAAGPLTVQEDAANVGGRVLTPEGLPVDDATVVLVPLGGGAIRAAGTAPDGYFEIGGVAAGRYRLWAACEAFSVHSRELDIDASGGEALAITLTPAAEGWGGLVPGAERRRFDEATLMLQRGEVGEGGGAGRALGIFDEFADRYPFLVLAHYNVGLCHAELATERRLAGDRAGAVKCELLAQARFAVVLERYPDYTGALAAAAESNIRLGDMSSAADLYARLLASVPDDPLHWYTYGEVLGYLHDLDASAAAFRRAIELDGEFADARAKLGAVLSVLGDPAGAAEQLEVYLRLDPESDMADSVRELLEECRERLRAEAEQGEPER